MDLHNVFEEEKYLEHISLCPDILIWHLQINLLPVHLSTYLFTGFILISINFAYLFDVSTNAVSSKICSVTLEQEHAKAIKQAHKLFCHHKNKTINTIRFVLFLQFGGPCIMKSLEGVCWFCCTVRGISIT